MCYCKFRTVSNVDPVPATEEIVETEVEVNSEDFKLTDRFVRVFCVFIFCSRVMCHVFFVYIFCSYSVQESDGPDLSTPTSTPTPTPTLLCTPEPPQRRKHSSTKDVDDAIIQLSKSVVERRNKKERREPENDETRNPEYHYAIKVAKTLSRLTSRNRSLAKMKIQQMLFELEFPADTMQSS